MARRNSWRETARRRTRRARRQSPHEFSSHFPNRRALYSRSLRLEPLEDRRLLALVTVTTLADTVDLSDGVTSLREAIFATNTVPGADTIDFAPALTAGGPATILLEHGELAITDSLTIYGPGAELLTIDASGNDPTPNSTLDDGDDTNDGDGSRVFRIDGTPGIRFAVAIHALQLTGGDTEQEGGAIYCTQELLLMNSIVRENSSLQRGGGIGAWQSIALDIQNSTVSNNFSGYFGGGIFHDGMELSIVDSTISGNQAVGNGGGIYSRSMRLVEILRNTISGNSADGAFAQYPGGGGLRVDSNLARINIAENTITGNSADFPLFRLNGGGGGIQLIRTRARITLVSGNAISENSAANGKGGGILVDWQASATIDRNLITENSAHRGGGIGFEPDVGGATTISNSVIANNEAQFSGGGILSSGIYGGTTSVTVLKSAVRDNTVTDVSGSGGGIDNDGTLILNSSTISGNETYGRGGGIYTSTTGSLKVQILQSTISGNKASVGGGIYARSQSEPISVSGTTITDNQAGSTGGGVFLGSGSLHLDHAIIARNLAYPSGELVGVLGSSIEAHYSLISSNVQSGLAESPPGMPDANGSLIGGPVNGVILPGLGLLANNGGYELPDGSQILTHALLPGSPAINLGNPEVMAGSNGVPPHDQRGEPFIRIYGGRVDVGAFELQPTNVLAGDYNHDGVVNAADYTVWRNNVGHDVARPGDGADGNGDGIVDVRDYRVWKSNYGTTLDLLPLSGRSGIALADEDGASSVATVGVLERFPNTAIVPRLTEATLATPLSPRSAATAGDAGFRSFDPSMRQQRLLNSLLASRNAIRRQDVEEPAPSDGGVARRFDTGAFDAVFERFDGHVALPRLT